LSIIPPVISAISTAFPTDSQSVELSPYISGRLDVDKISMVSSIALSSETGSPLIVGVFSLFLL
jgi:hypothetical protein